MDDVQDDINELGMDDILGSLSSLDSEKPDDEAGDKKDDKIDDPDKKDDDLDDDEKKDEDKEEAEKEIKIEDKDNIELTDAPNRKEILKAFPDIFKKFPSLESAIYREHQYSEIFPTLDQAKEAQARSESLGRVEGELLDGNLTDLLTRVKRTDSKAFDKISSKILQTLRTVDKEAYLGTMSRVVKDALMSATKYGKANDNGEDGNDGRQLTIAARLLHKYIFNDPNVTPAPEVEEEKADPAADALSKREQEFNQQQLNTAMQGVVSDFVGKVRSAIEKHIDPRGAMGDYLKKTAVSDVLKALDEEMTGDKRFRAIMDGLWLASRKDGFSSASKAKVREALVRKAQQLLPEKIRKIRAVALKGSSARKRIEDKDEEVDRPKSRREAAPQNDRRDSSKNGKKKADASSVSSIVDFLGD